MSTTTGNLLVALGNGNTATTEANPPFTDSQTLTWVRVQGKAAAGGGLEGLLYCAKITAGSPSHTVTFYYPTQTSATIVVFEVNQQDATTPISDGADAQVTQGGTAASLATAALTNSNANALCIVWGGNTGNGANNQSFPALTGGGTYTIPTNGKQDDFAGVPTAMAYQVVSAAASRSATYNTGSAVSEFMVTGIAYFKEATAAAAAQPAPLWWNANAALRM
jgi:hypothetical protein